jgi:ketosteroid isomerase-like protein
MFPGEIPNEKGATVMATTTQQTSPDQLFHRLVRHLISDPAEPVDEQLWAADVVVEVPFAQGGMFRIEGRDQFLAFAEQGRRALPIRFEEARDVVVHHSVDSNVVIGEYELAATHTATGQRVSARFIGVLTAGNGQIARWREYQDTLAILTALGARTEDLSSTGDIPQTA